MFGAIVAILAAALLCFAVFTSSSPGTSHIGTAFLLIFSARGIFWGVAQIVGYRKAKRSLPSDQLSPPQLDTALGCVFLGLMLALVAVLFYEFARGHPLYSLLSGGASALLLIIGTVTGIRQGVWRNND
jgi:hypothetical protein